MPDAKRVLFLDDDPAIGALFERTVKEAGFSTDVVTSEEEALRLGRTQTYSVLVIDLALGNWNGLDILEQLAPRQAAAGLILVSAHFPDDREIAIDGRTVHMLAKPWHQNRLLEMLEQVLARAPVPATAR